MLWVTVLHIKWRTIWNTRCLGGHLPKGNTPKVTFLQLLYEGWKYGHAARPHAVSQYLHSSYKVAAVKTAAHLVLQTEAVSVKGAASKAPVPLWEPQPLCVTYATAYCGSPKPLTGKSHKLACTLASDLETSKWKEESIVCHRGLCVLGLVFLSSCPSCFIFL